MSESGRNIKNSIDILEYLTEDEVDRQYRPITNENEFGTGGAAVEGRDVDG